ncbi:TonB-dependent receptor [Sphingomonas immobilis]|uniref:TonB-dependent receptor n=1 Tax=Sphingomonas immobilis TaxID=3063997 RepID=A0ABT8ZUY3_9SPHN|nr:TonB-dependent receptor [Sphingomonas sp. CA1-15]MDO7840800.1 TonB-dependent receptor [Sphingomonas sp. CA1-15]
MRALALASLAAGTAWPASLHAQSAAPAAAPAAPSKADAGIADIVVTAERRESTIQRTPIAITAINGGALTKAGITNARDLTGVIPGLELRQNTAGVAIFIRGVGTENRTIGSDPSNVFTLDGIALNSRASPDALFFDVDRVEVLKGPQGTLYGRNAVGGAVNLLTRDPSLGAIGGYGILGYGNYNAVKAEGALNLPLSSTVAIRIAANRVTHDGYLDHGTFTQQPEPSSHANDEDTTAGRVKLLWQPSSAVRLILNADYAQNRGRGPGYLINGPTNSAAAGAVNIAGFVNNDPWLDPCSDQVRTAVAGLSRSPVAIGAACSGFVRQKTWAVGGNLQVDFGPVKWTTLANIRESDDNYRYFFRWDSVRTIGHVTEKTVETRLASNGSSPLTWVAGFYYFNESGSQIDWAELNTALYSATNKPNNTATSYGVFGQATYSLLDNLRVTGGVRYSHDEKAFTGLATQNQPVEGLYPDATALKVANQATFSKVNYRAAVELDASPRNLIYASVSSGYHAGGLAPGDPTGPYISHYDPETLTAFAIGSKNRFFGNRLQINAELFYWKYQNLLFTTRGFVNCASCGAVPTNPPTPAGSTIALVTYNAGRAYIYGADIDVLARITPTTTFSGNLYLNKSEYQDFAISPLNAALNAKGNRLANIPATQASAALEQRIPLGNGANITGAVRWRYLGPTWTGPSHNVPGSRLGARNTADLDLTYSPRGDRWSVTAYIRNVANAANMLSGSGNGGDREPTTGALWGSIAPPRTFGGQVQYKF